MADADAAVSAYDDVFAIIAAHAAAADRPDGTLDAEIGWLHKAGALSAALPAALTGVPGWADRPVAVAAVLRTLGRASLPVGRLYEGHINAGQLIALYGSPVLRRRAATVAARGELLGVWGADGADPVTAAADGTGFRLNGQKTFCSGLGLVGLALLSAAVDGGTRLFAVAVDDPARADPAMWDMSGMRATRSGSYDFTALTVAADAVVGDPDDYYREPYFLGGMYRMGAVQVGGIDALVAAFASELNRRGHAADPIQQYRLGKCGTLQLLAASVVDRVARHVNRFDPTDVGREAVLMREGIEHCTTGLLHLVERGSGTAAHRAGGDLDRVRRDLGLYIRQGALDVRLRAAGAAIACELDQGRGGGA